MSRSSIAHGAVLLFVIAMICAVSYEVVARGYVTNRGDFLNALSQTSYDEQHKSDFFQALRNQCSDTQADSVTGFRLGGRQSPVANIDHSCARYTTCDGRVIVPGRSSFNFALQCR